MSTINVEQRLLAVAMFAAAAFIVTAIQRKQNKPKQRLSMLQTMACVAQSESVSAVSSPTKRTSVKQSDVVALPDETVQGPRLMEGNGINKIYLHDINSLRETFPSVGVSNNISATYNKVMGEEDYILSDIVRKQRLADNRKSEAFVRAGPRSTTHFDPTKVRAAIVTCGGLCPGLNNVVRELVHSLCFLYGVHEGEWWVVC
jgi:hypothetical protein